MKTLQYVASVMSVWLTGLVPVYSQQVVPGISAGASLNSVKLKSIPELSTDFSQVNGVEAGFYLQFKSGGWYFRPMALAGFLRGSVSSTYDEAQPVKSDFEMSTLETPLLVGVRMLPFLSLEAGPSWNYLMSYTDEINGVNLDLNRNALGYRAGARLTFARLGVFGHYGGTLSELGDSKFHLERPSRLTFGVTFDLAGDSH